MRRSSSTIGFSKSSQVPFMRISESALEGDGLVHGAHEGHGALAETATEVGQELFARAHEQVPRTDVGFLGLARGAHEEVYRAPARVATQEVPEHFEGNPV